MRIAHTMIRVGDLEKSIAFYTELLGMQVFKKKDYPKGKFTLVFVGYDPNAASIELTYNWEGPKSYEVGTGFGHLAIETHDIYALCAKVEAGGGKVPRPPAPMKYTASDTVEGKPEAKPETKSSTIAFIEDPDGYKIEVIERASLPSSTHS